MRRSNLELWVSFGGIIWITFFYLGVIFLTGSIPSAQGFFGHSLGIVGFILMLMTETLYSFRKRSRNARWGRMSRWLQFHIVTGLVGPYMVFLHTAWKFNGLAGILMLMTFIIVISGFIGRYIFTAIPRNADGVAMEVEQINFTVSQINAQLTDLSLLQPELFEKLKIDLDDHSQKSNTRQQIRALRKLARRLNSKQRPKIRQIENILLRRQTLDRQIASLATTRRMLSLWHAIHIPIGVALFTVAFIHIGAALYYATLLK